MTGYEQFYSMANPAVAPIASVSMKHSGFGAKIMRAPKLVDNGRKHRLPPGTPIPTFPVDCLPGCPKEWISEGGFVCPVEPDWGIWFDWRENDKMNTAVVPSVKGMNPITGRPMEGPCLEAYEKSCPKHGVQFAHGRFCNECGYEWPPQNYVTHESRLWWDGFRQPDGSVRQFFFTDDDKRDIASLVIGKQNTVPAFGFVFYEPVVARWHEFVLARSPIDDGSGGWTYCGDPAPGQPNQCIWTVGKMTYDHNAEGKHNLTGHSPMFSVDTTGHGPAMDGMYFTSCTDDLKSGMPVDGLSDIPVGTRSVAESEFKRSLAKRNIFRVATPGRQPVSKDVSVGAGAMIDQDLFADGLGLDGWKQEPSSVIRLYFCFREQFEAIVSEGVRIAPSKAGFMAGLPVG
jgi:hypothetical protein